MNSLRQIVHALEIGRERLQKSVGLSGAQLLVLQILQTGGVMSINELAEKSHTHQSSVSVVVGRLVEAGLVKRTRAVGVVVGLVGLAVPHTFGVGHNNIEHILDGLHGSDVCRLITRIPGIVIGMSARIAIYAGLFSRPLLMRYVPA